MWNELSSLPRQQEAICADMRADYTGFTCVRPELIFIFLIWVLLQVRNKRWGCRHNCTHCRPKWIRPRRGFGTDHRRPKIGFSDKYKERGREHDSGKAGKAASSAKYEENFGSKERKGRYDNKTEATDVTVRQGSTKGAKLSLTETELLFLEAFCYLIRQGNMGDKSAPHARAPSPSAPNIMLDFSQFLAAQCPLPGQPGAPCFDGKEVTRFVRSWERFSERYRLTSEKMVKDLVDYCELAISEYVAIVVDEARREEQETASTNLLAANLSTGEPSWACVRTKLLRRFKEDDSEQQRNTVTYLRSLSSDRHFRVKAGDVEGYIRTYQQISNILVAETRLTVFDQMICFLQGLPDNIATKIFEDMRLDVDEPASFNILGGFSKAVAMALTMTRKKANVSKMYELKILTGEQRIKGKEQVQSQQYPMAPVTRILKHPDSENAVQTSEAPLQNQEMQEAGQLHDQMEMLKRELEELKLFRQSAMPLLSSQPGGQRGYQPRNNYSQENRNMPATESIPVNDRGCRWCGLNNHRKHSCYEYTKALKEGTVHYADEADLRTRMGPMGSGGPLVPLPEAAGVWQKVWVSNMRQRTESQGTVPPKPNDRMAEVGKGSTSEVRNLMLEYTPPRREEGVADGPFPMTSKGGPELEVGEIRTYLALQDNDGNTTGWVEAKRGADDMEDSITVDAGELLRKKRQKQRHYPGVGLRNRPEMTIEDSEDESDGADRIRSGVQVEEVLDIEEPGIVAEEVQQAKKTKKRAPRKEGDIQPARKVPVKLRAEAEPEKMVNKILNQNIDGITVREVLGLSPDLLRELWGLKRLPALKGAAQVPAISGDKTGIPVVDDNVNLTSSRVERISVEKHLYACASPMVLGRLEGTRKVKMLIDSGSEMCVMSRKLWQELEDELPIDRDIAWSIGSANATRDRVYGVCHSVSVNIGGVEVNVPIFVLEEAAQDLILGRPWERKTRAQYDNRDDGSLYITISTPDDQRKVVFCAVGTTDDRNRDRARIQRYTTSMTRENGQGSNTRDKKQGNSDGSQIVR